MVRIGGVIAGREPVTTPGPGPAPAPGPVWGAGRSSSSSLSIGALGPARPGIVPTHAAGRSRSWASGPPHSGAGPGACTGGLDTATQIGNRPFGPNRPRCPIYTSPTYPSKPLLSVYLSQVSFKSLLIVSVRREVVVPGGYFLLILQFKLS